MNLFNKLDWQKFRNENILILNGNTRKDRLLLADNLDFVEEFSLSLWGIVLGKSIYLLILKLKLSCKYLILFW